ncbi:MAG TPA: nucleoside hydrolase [Opitutaceae bacterium]|nr:nucleoside hydrolase [Opitutaceae bacterium]
MIIRFPLAALACLVAATASTAAGSKMKVIIDQDAFGPGGSNIQAILMVVQDPKIEVLGITIVSGDGWQKEEVAHTLRMLELIGRTDIPVIPGATNPLINSEEETRRWEKTYGKLAYKGAWMDSWPDYNTVNRPHYHAADVVPALEEGEPTTKPANDVAANFIVRKLHEFPGQVTVLAMGPFTNLALASRLDEGFAAPAKDLIIMGGSFNPSSSSVDEFALQFINSPRVEFNDRWDPEAGKMMLHAGWKKIVVIPTDATVGTKFTKEVQAKATAGCDTPAARYVAKFGEIGFPMWDEIASAVFMDPTIIRQSDQVAMDIDISHGQSYGSTVSWAPANAPGLGEPVVTVVRSIDIPRLEQMFADEVRRPPQTP